MSYVILFFCAAAFVFAFLFIRPKFKKPEGSSTKWLLLFLACIVPVAVCFCDTRLQSGSHRWAL